MMRISIGNWATTDDDDDKDIYEIEFQAYGTDEYKNTAHLIITNLETKEEVVHTAIDIPELSGVVAAFQEHTRSEMENDRLIKANKKVGL